MIEIRRGSERGHANHGWLDTYHTFSFDTYYDPKHVHFRHLRVINEDRVAPGKGFPTHPHRDMEIITYVLEGAIEHKDSMGTGSVIRPGEIQHMSAGTGVTHSEFNPSKSELLHLLQIWIMPETKGVRPSYDQKATELAKHPDELRLIASGSQAGDSAVKINQDTNLYASVLQSGGKVRHALQTNRYAWLQVARGKVQLNGVDLEAGDGAAVTAETNLEIQSQTDSEILLFDLK
jgi:redox-sensitive bicupin YhaK (pirin superfamily)